MHKFPVLSGKEVINALGKAGFQVVSQKGSHVKLRKTGFDQRKLTVIVPLKKVIRIRTFKSILRQAGMNLEELLKFV